MEDGWTNEERMKSIKGEKKGSSEIDRIFPWDIERDIGIREWMNDWNG